MNPRAGADVVLADLPEKKGELAALAGQVGDLGRKARTVSMDVRDRASVDAAFAEVARWVSPRRAAGAAGRAASPVRIRRSAGAAVCAGGRQRSPVRHATASAPPRSIHGKERAPLQGPRASGRARGQRRHPRHDAAARGGRGVCV